MSSVSIVSDLRPIYQGDPAEPVTASPANHMFTYILNPFGHAPQWVSGNGLAILQISSQVAPSSCYWPEALCAMRDAIVGCPGHREPGMIRGPAL
jgi:hypothetical protein